MPQIRIHLDEETYSVLMHRAEEDLRDLGDQAVVLIRKGLGLPFPYPPIIDITGERRQAVPHAVGS
jgi:hypothetical protein